jgi:hypothetical protein
VLSAIRGYYGRKGNMSSSGQDDGEHSIEAKIAPLQVISQHRPTSGAPPRGCDRQDVERAPQIVSC